jgi:N-acetylated-alpha-linked acidic dipeptidase
MTQTSIRPVLIRGRYTRRLFQLLPALLACVALAGSATDDQSNLQGYFPDSAHTEREWETKFRAVPSPDKMRDYMRRLSAHPHHTGSPYDRDNAEWILSKFKDWGLPADIETFYVLFPTPKERAVELLQPTKFVAKLEEPAIEEDPTSSQRDEQLPTYNAYSIDGDVTGPLVYVNYGIPSDYEQLERLGISVKGAIVIARYGASWRGIKPKVAAEHGAVGCLIYSDPRDDGYFGGDVFPNGAWRPKDGVQRGSVLDMTLYSGDPLTPGVGATMDARRLPLRDVKVLTKIPTLPLSYADAQPLLAALAGPIAPEQWRGALNQPYHIGAGPARVHLKVKFNWDIKPVYNVIVRIPGAVYADEWVIRGNHHDAWVNGAEDPGSAQVALLEEARGLSELLKQGWKPKRTIVYCAWDGEEQGLLGSTEWVETHADELRAKAAVYINSDSNGRGYLNMSGSHTLERFINGVARDIKDPETNMSAWKRDQLARIERGSAEERAQARTRPDLRIGALGSGSDYSAFLQHLGIASLNLSYGGEDGGGIYHSIYDDFYWYTHFSDTKFVYCRALAQTAGTAVMRFADADLLPYDFIDFADTLRTYVDSLKELLKTAQDEARERKLELQEQVFTATADPQRPSFPPKPEPDPPYLNFAPLENSVEEIRRAAEHYQKALARAEARGAMAPRSVTSIDQKLVQSERELTLPQGLPRRPWYVHQIYAPGYYTGYGVKTIPGVREAIEEKNWQEADVQAVIAGKVLASEATLIESAATEMDNVAQ